MANVMTNPSFFPVRVNDYVAAMQYSADVNHNGATRVSFGVPLAPNATLVASGVSIAAALTTDLTAIPQFPETYGRNITLVASGASTASVSVNGWDYLGQPVTETLVLAGSTPVVGNKAFKTLRSVVNNSNTAGTTINVGSGAKFGLPYKAISVRYEISAGVLIAVGTLQAASLVDPQTAATSDPRGMYTPTTTPNGVADITALFDFINDLNAAGRGGLHGLPQFAG